MHFVLDLAELLISRLMFSVLSQDELRRQRILDGSIWWCQTELIQKITKGFDCSHLWRVPSLRLNNLVRDDLAKSSAQLFRTFQLGMSGSRSRWKYRWTWTRFQSPTLSQRNSIQERNERLDVRNVLVLYRWWTWSCCRSEINSGCAQDPNSQIVNCLLSALGSEEGKRALAFPQDISLRCFQLIQCGEDFQWAFFHLMKGQDRKT